MKKIVDKSIISICIWYNPNTKEYYYKLLTSLYFEKSGFKNSYGHELILVIDVYRDILRNRKMPFYLKILKKFISLLQKLDNKLTKKYLF